MYTYSEAEPTLAAASGTDIEFCIGGALLLIGIIMLILPGPAIVFIPLGLAILATEFRWAKNWLIRTRQWIRSRSANLLRAKASK